MGIVVALFCILAEKKPAFGALALIASSAVAAFVSRVIYTFTRICVSGVTLSVITYLLPGLNLTIGVTELATRHMVSGTSRFFFALITAVQLGFGVALGANLAVWLPPINQTCVSEFSAWFNFLFFPLSSLSLIILLNAHFKQWPAMGVASTVAYLTSYFGQLFFPPEVTAAMASFGVVVVANLYARFFNKPAITVALAGILLLVPGSIGVVGVGFLISNDIISGITFGFRMIIIALSITVGMLLGNAIVWPSKSLEIKKF